MSALHHWGYFIAAFYIVILGFILRLASRPNCRNCLHRENCPNRVVFGVPNCVQPNRKGQPSESPALAAKPQ